MKRNTKSSRLALQGTSQFLDPIYVNNGPQTRETEQGELLELTNSDIKCPVQVSRPTLGP